MTAIIRRFCKVFGIFKTLFVCMIVFSSCNSATDKKVTQAADAQDSMVIISVDSTKTNNSPEEIVKNPISDYAKELPKATKEIQYLKKNYEIASSETLIHKRINYSPITSSIDRLVVEGKTEGSVAYYCPNRMLENTDNNVSVSISKSTIGVAIDQLEKKVAATTGQHVEIIHKNVNGAAISISAKMKVELKYSDKDFETIYKPENDDQIFDGTNDMNWDWIIKPTQVGIKQLSIIISAYDGINGRWIAVQTPPKIFDIKVQVDPRGYFAKLWGFLESNPEWIFIQILFPVIAFFFGRRQGKKII